MGSFPIEGLKAVEPLVAPGDRERVSCYPKLCSLWDFVSPQLAPDSMPTAPINACLKLRGLPCWCCGEWGKLVVDGFAVDFRKWGELSRCLILVGRRGAAEHNLLSCGLVARPCAFTDWGLPPSRRMRNGGRRSPGWLGWLSLVLLWEDGLALFAVRVGRGLMTVRMAEGFFRSCGTL